MTATTPASASSAPLLAVHDIHKRFGSNEVLKGVSLQARAGDKEADWTLQIIRLYQ